jgi:hypothetical protein
MHHFIQRHHRIYIPPNIVDLCLCVTMFHPKLFSFLASFYTGTISHLAHKKYFSISRAGNINHSFVICFLLNIDTAFLEHFHLFARNLKMPNIHKLFFCCLLLCLNNSFHIIFLFVFHIWIKTFRIPKHVSLESLVINRTDHTEREIIIIIMVKIIVVIN